MIGENFNEFAHFLLLDRLSDVAKASGVGLGQCFFEQQTTRGRFEVFTVGLAHLDLGVDLDRAFIECSQDFPVMTEDATFTQCPWTFVGEVVRTNDEVLARGHNRTTRSRRQNVVGAEHEHASFSLSFC